MSCAKTRTFVMTCTFVWISVSKKIIAQVFNAICRIQKFPQFIGTFRAMLTSVLWQNQQLLWNCSDWTLPSAFWKIRPCLGGQWPLRLLGLMLDVDVIKQSEKLVFIFAKRIVISEPISEFINGTDITSCSICCSVISQIVSWFDKNGSNCLTFKRETKYPS